MTAEFLGVPIIYNRHVPRGTAYLINENMMVIGTWVEPIRQSVNYIIAMQRRRRHR